MIIISDIHTKMSKSLMTEMVEDELTRDVNKTVIVCGDVTHRAKEDEYKKVTQWFESLMSKGIGIVLCAGNHDLTIRFPVGNVKNPSGRKRYGELSDIIEKQSIVVDRADDFDFIYKVNQDIFCAFRSTHSKWYKGLRIKKDQYEWASEVLIRNGYLTANGYRLHLVTHHSLWECDEDRHGHMHKRKRLVKKFLRPFEFASAINGHNHRFHAEYQDLKKRYSFLHIQAPTLSDRTKGGRFTPGFVKWNPEVEDSAVFVPIPL